MYNSFIFLLYLTISIIISPCRPVLGNEEIKGIQLSYEMRFKNFEGQDQKINSLVDIIYMNEYTMLKVPYYVNHTETKYDKDLKVESITESGIDTAYNYFIYTRDAKHGLKYNSLSATAPTRFSVDSLLEKCAFKTMPFYDSKKDSLISVTKPKSKNKYTRIEEFNRKLTDGTRTDNQVFLYYSKDIQQCDFSFSKELDSKKNGKICKVIFLFNPVSPEEAKKYSFKIPRQKMVFQIYDVDIKNKVEIIASFTRFTNDSVLYKL